MGTSPLLFGTIVAATCSLATAGASAPVRAQSDPAVATLVKQAYRAAFNLDREEAMGHARRAVAMAPGEPAPHRAVAAMLWLQMLFERGAVTIDHYMRGLKPQTTLPKPPPELEAEFRRELAQAIDLASARIQRNARDVQARYDLGSAYALQASYAASIEGSTTSAFMAARRAYDAQEAVLVRDPQRLSAGLVVGTYRYMVSTMALPSRMIAYVAGFGGGKERGIKMVEGALGDPEVRTDAAVALLLVYTREGRHPDALRVLGDLEREFPRNRIFVLESGATALRAGLATQAEATLSRGIAALDTDPRPKFPGERALWLYKRGMARVQLNRTSDAQADLTAALASAPLDWVRARIHLEQGKIADLGGRRVDALAAYREARAIGEKSNDPACVSAANRLLQTPFVLSRKPGR